jgi:predicted O-methyltransferase YrrM
MMYTKRLNELAAQFGSDKLENGYMKLYSEYFERQKIKPEGVRNVLEIGTNKGSSLRIWAEFFPNATVYGIDITRVYEVASHLEHPNIITHLVDQSSEAELGTYIRETINNRKFDIIIDDGSHDQYDQQLSLAMLFPLLKDGGLYVVEDLITGEDWWSAQTYNKRNVRATRIILQEFQQINSLPENLQHIQPICSYCEYRESSVTIFDIHHPQLAFLGRK